MVSPELLRQIVCPDDRSPLRVADAATVEQINRQISAGQCRNVAGQNLTRPIDGGLVRADGRRLYPILDGVPQLVADDAILLPGGDGPK